MRRTVFNEDHEAFRETLRDFIEAEVVPVYPEWYAAGIVPREFYYKLAGLGLFGIEVPEEYGGAGIKSFKYNAIESEELARASVSFGGSSVHTALCLPYLLKLATDGQKERWLPPFMTGDMMFAIAMTEPGTEHDLGWRGHTDRAGHLLGPGWHADDGQAVGRREPLRPQRGQDVHHRRRARRPGDRLRPHGTAAGGRPALRHLAARRRHEA